MRPHAFHPEAAREYNEAIDFYREIDSALANRFYDHIEGLIEELRRDPAWYWMFDPPARRHFNSDFPYAVIYLDQPERIWIVAIMELHRQPGYWRKRLK